MMRMVAEIVSEERRSDMFGDFEAELKRFGDMAK